MVVPRKRWCKGSGSLKPLEVTSWVKRWWECTWFSLSLALSLFGWEVEGALMVMVMAMAMAMVGGDQKEPALGHVKVWQRFGRFYIYPFPSTHDAHPQSQVKSCKQWICLACCNWNLRATAEEEIIWKQKDWVIVLQSNG